MPRLVLVSFLGKGIRASENRQRSHLGYQTARYDFTQLGGAFEETSLFGLALLRYLCSRNQLPNLWLVLGSPQSLWDALVEAVDIDLWSDFEDVLKRVEQAVRDENPNASRGGGHLTEELLQEWGQTLSRYLHPTQVRCFLIGWSYDRAEQERLWHILHSQTEPKDHLILDITHGFRHQPMLTAFMVMLLNRLKQFSALEFYYGALDMTPHLTRPAEVQGQAPYQGERETPPTPVLRIDFVNDLVHATEVLATYQETGDYEPLADFALHGEVQTQVQNLIFEQRVNKPRLSALEPALTALTRFEAPDSLRASLVPLVQREVASLREGSLYGRLVRQAVKAMEHDNYMVAIPLLWEAVLSLACQLTGNGSPEEYRSREAAELRLVEQQNAYLTDHERGILRDLREVRNAIVHGTRRSERAAVKSALSSKEGMKQLFDQAREIYDRLYRSLPRGQGER